MSSRIWKWMGYGGGSAPNSNSAAGDASRDTARNVVQYAPSESSGGRHFRVALLGAMGVGKSRYLITAGPSRPPTADSHIYTFLVPPHMAQSPDPDTWTTLDVCDGLFTGDVTVDAYLIMYDVTNWSSFQEVINWVNEIRHGKLSGASTKPIMVIGNKSELQKQRQVRPDDAALYGLPFVEVSSVTANNVQMPIWKLAQVLNAHAADRP